MPWGAAATIGAAAISANSAKKAAKGGAGSSTASKDPWIGAVPWIGQSVNQGMAIQDQLSRNPFSEQQLAAYGNSNALSDYQRSLVPSLLGQLSSQPLGYDPANPTARATPFDFTQGLNLFTSGNKNLTGLGNTTVSNDETFKWLENKKAQDIASNQPWAPSLLQGVYEQVPAGGA